MKKHKIYIRSSTKLIGPAWASPARDTTSPTVLVPNIENHIVSLYGASFMQSQIELALLSCIISTFNWNKSWTPFKNKIPRPKKRSDNEKPKYKTKPRMELTEEKPKFCEQNNNEDNKNIPKSQIDQMRNG